jgi:molecular chaperone GrpE
VTKDHPNRPAAGPVAGESTSSAQAAGDAPAPAPPAEEPVERDLEALIAEAEQQRDEYLELARRTRADFENYRKRIAAETKAAANRGKAELARELILVIDDLERALAAAGLDPSAALDGEPVVEGALEQGVLLVYRGLTESLRGAGVEPYDPAGEKFDPSWHEALQTRAEEGTEPGTIVEVLQRGYRLDGQVLRAARVVVSE